MLRILQYIPGFIGVAFLASICGRLDIYGMTSGTGYYYQKAAQRRYSATQPLMHQTFRSRRNALMMTGTSPGSLTRTSAAPNEDLTSTINHDRSHQQVCTSSPDVDLAHVPLLCFDILQFTLCRHHACCSTRYRIHNFRHIIIAEEVDIDVCVKQQVPSHPSK